MSVPYRCLLLALAVGWSAPVAAAELTEPYRVRLVLHVERHRLLTDVFREQLRRELGDNLQATLGEAARVEVTDDHPLLPDIRKRGLGRAVEGYRERSGELTYFVLIRFSGSDYEIELRGHNGIVGLPARAVRHARTRDRAYVGRTAALLLDHNLGLVGTVVSEPDGSRQVRVELRGGGLGVDLGRWVKKDEVFALVRQEGGSSVPLSLALLQVVQPPREGVCLCVLYSRFRQTSVTGLTAVLLGTQSGPLRLRLMQERPGGGSEPLRAAVTLQLRRRGFEGEEATRLQINTRPGRDIDTSSLADKGNFDRLAFVSVLTGDTLRARIPVAILDDRLTVLTLPATSEENDLITLRHRSLLNNVANAYLVQMELFREINELTARPEQRGEAIARVRHTLKRLNQDHTQLMAKYDEVRAEVSKLPAAERPDLERILERLRLIRAGEADLLRTVATLEKIEQEENDPKRKEWLVQLERAKLLEKEGEIEQAIAVYEKAPAGMATPAVKARLAELKMLWQPRDDRHRAARSFIIETWPTLDTPGLKARMKEAQDALGVCRSVGDQLGATRLLRATEKHAQRLLKELGELKPAVNIDDERPARLIQELVPELRRLDSDVRAFLASKTPAP